MSARTYLVVVNPGTTPMTLEEPDTTSDRALVSSGRPEIDGGSVSLGQAMMIRHERR